MKDVNFFGIIDKISDKACRVVGFLSILLMLNVCIGVFFRYVLKESYIWGFPLNQQIFGVFILFAGVYAMLTGNHLRVDIISSRFPPKVSMIAGIVNLAVFIIFMSLLIWRSSILAINSINVLEQTPGTPRFPLYPFKTFIPIMVSLFLLLGISQIYKNHIKVTKSSIDIDQRKGVQQ